MTILEEINEIKKIIIHRDWVLNELKKFEDKYGLITKEFIDKWRSKKIPEPDEHIILEEFLEWDGLAESLDKIDNELKALEDRIREN